MDDSELLTRFVDDSSEPAFAALVERHLGFVYAAALRQVAGNTGLAQDVAQQVFIQLARKAHTLRHHPTLTGWLFTSTRFAAANAARGEARRQLREKKAHAMHAIATLPEPEVDWSRLRPFIDDALAELPEPDRVAVLQRYCEGRGFAEIGAPLSITADAARLRIERALEKVRSALRRRSVRSTAAAITALLANEAAATVPPGLAATISAGALAATGTAGAVLGFFGGMKFVTAAALVGVVGTALWIEFDTRSAAHELASIDAPPAAPAPASPAVASAPVAPAGGAEPSAAPALANLTAGPLAWSLPSAAAAPRTPKPPLTPAERLAQQRRIVEREYGPILDRLDVTPEQRAQLLQLLLDLRETTVDYLAAVKSMGTDPTADRDTTELSIFALRTGLWDKIHAILGDEKYLAFTAGDVDMRRQSVVNNVQKRLRRTAEPLTAQQQSQLVATMRDLDAYHVTDDVLMAAGGFLTPTQLAALQAIQANRRLGITKPNTQRALDVETAPPATGPAPAP